MLIVGAVLAILIGLAHSYLGEKYILIHLFRMENLPMIGGSDWFTKRTLRFAWHLTTIAWWGFAAIMLVLANPNNYSQKFVLIITATVFAVSSIISAAFTNGTHLSWIVFLSIAAICFFAPVGLIIGQTKRRYVNSCKILKRVILHAKYRLFRQYPQSRQKLMRDWTVRSLNILAGIQTCTH